MIKLRFFERSTQVTLPAFCARLPVIAPQAAASFQPDYLEADEEEEEEVKIVRTKKFDIKPMYPEDACVQMELLGHSFYVFCNAETDQVNVVYRRKGNTYGLIEPEV